MGAGVTAAPSVCQSQPGPSLSGKALGVGSRLSQPDNGSQAAGTLKSTGLQKLAGPRAGLGEAGSS